MTVCSCDLTRSKALQARAARRAHVAAVLSAHLDDRCAARRVAPRTIHCLLVTPRQLSHPGDPATKLQKGTKGDKRTSATYAVLWVVHPAARIAHANTRRMPAAGSTSRSSADAQSCCAPSSGYSPKEPGTAPEGEAHLGHRRAVLRVVHPALLDDSSETGRNFPFARQPGRADDSSSVRQVKATMDTETYERLRRPLEVAADRQSHQWAAEEHMHPQPCHADRGRNVSLCGVCADEACNTYVTNVMHALQACSERSRPCSHTRSVE
jgi:hypothetical protein